MNTPPDIAKRKCSGACGLEKPHSDFYSPRHGSCKECVKAKKRATTDLRRTVEAEQMAKQVLGLEGFLGLTEVERAETIEAVKAEVKARLALAQKQPEAMTEDFTKAAISSAQLFLTRTTPATCSCCRSSLDVDTRATFKICAHCALSVDICGRCVVHWNTTVFRPDLVHVTPPKPQDVLKMIKELENDGPPINRQRLRDEKGQLPPEPDE